MAMTLGSVSIDGNGNVAVKSGVIGRYYDALIASLTVTIPSGSSGAVFKQQLAAQATAQGTAMYNSITQDGKARVTQEDIGLQRMPASTTENTNCKGPAETKFLTIV